MTIPRRAVLHGLAGLGALAAWPRGARAFGASSRLDIAELMLAQGTVSRPSAWSYLLSELQRTTSVVCEPRSVEVSPETAELFEHPFAVLLVDGALPEPSDAMIEKLRAFLAYGGFLFIDDTTGGQDRAADRSVRGLIARLFPNRPLATLPAEHSLHRAFFLMRDGTPGRLAQPRWMEGVTVGTLTPVVYGQTDLSGALLRSVTGQPALPCTPGGERQRTEALKVGVNLVLYALTANYKNDQVHIRELMLRRRLR